MRVADLRLAPAPKIQTSNFSAEYGRQAGAAINVVTRSGGNQLRGSLFEFFRDDSMDKTTFFAAEKPKLRVQNYGWTLGGRIRRNKAFFFGGQEWRDIDRTGNPVRRTLPTRAQRRGDFSGTTGNLFFPGTTIPVPNGNISALITPQGRAIAAVYDAMEALAALYVDESRPNNAIYQLPSPYEFRQDILRLDYRIDKRHTVYGRYVHDGPLTADPFGTNVGSPSGSGFREDGTNIGENALQGSSTMSRILLGLVFPLLIASAGWAQTQANTGQIEGTVSDPSGAVISEAIVRLRNTATNQLRVVRTNAQGFYRASLLQIGPYEITVESPSFASYQQSGIALSTGEILTLNAQLGLAGTEQQVTVVAGASIVETSRTNLSRAVNEIDVAELPNLSSSELNFAFLQPFVSGDPPREYEAPRLDFGGLSRRLNFQVDGFQNSTVQQKAFRVIIFSTAALQETQIASYGATAESGRTGGPGVVNNIIKSGTNELRGTARFSTYRKAFNALPYRSLPGNEPSGNTFAGGVGGPIERDRLFFFASYEASKRAFPTSLGFTSEAARANLARLGFAGKEVDVLPSTFNPQLWLLKMDWRPNATQSLAVRGNTFREFFAARDPGGTTVLSTSNGAIFNEGAGAVAWTSILASRMLNEFRTQVADRLTRRRPVVEPGPDTLPTTTISGVATFGYPTGLTANREKIVEFSDNVSWLTGTHQLKAGFNIIQSPLRFEDQLNGTFTFGGLTARPERPAVTALDHYLHARAGLIDPSTGRPYTYTQLSVAFGEPVLTYAVRYYGLYAQDEWRVHPALTLNYGVRWETVTPPEADQTSPHDLSRQFRQDRDNIAPRAGFAWAPRSSTTTVIRGSYGLHFDAPQANYYRDVLQQDGQRQFSATIAGTAAGAPVYPSVPTSAGGLTAARSSITVMDPEFEWMYVHQAQLSLGRAITDDLSLTLSYALTRGRKIPIILNPNLAPPVGTLVDGRNLYSTARLDPRFNNINTITALSRSNYNGLGVNVNKRFDRRSPVVLRDLQFNLAYTWSHALDDAPESGIGGGSELPQDSFDRAADYGTALADVRHVFNASAVFRPRARNRWLDDNQISLILFARSGSTFDVRAGTDLNRDSVNNDRPPFVGRNTHKGPGSVQLDTRYARFFRFGGRYKLQLLAEAANLLNRPNPDATNASVNRTYGTGDAPVATFGQVIRFREMRRVQLGVRFDF